MAIERWCEIANNMIMNTLLVDPETEDGASYLAMQADAGVVLMPEELARAQYPYWTPPDMG